MEGPNQHDPIGGELPDSQDRVWRHPAERGAIQAEANLAARRAQGRRWPSMLVSFIAGGAFVGLIWILQDQAQAPIEEDVSFEISAPDSLSLGPLSVDEWTDEVAQLNRESVVGLELTGDPHHRRAQAIRLGTSGYLIASAFSLEGAEEIGVVLSDGSPTPPAQVLGSDPVSGVAVLKINATSLEPPTFADDTDVSVRDRLVALAQSSVGGEAQARAVDVLSDNQVTALPNGDLLSGLLRLSTELSDPWTGSAILEENGGIVGMTVEARDGTHYAIPISTARGVAQQLIDGEAVDHGAWLGVEMGDLSDGIKAERELLGGVLISRVWDETPAARGGLLAGDIIIGIDDANIIDRLDLQLQLGSLSPNDSVEVRYSRVDSSPLQRDPLSPEPDLTGEIHTTSVIVGARTTR